jgi:hypothetical protein
MKIRFSYVDGGIHPKLGQVFHRRAEAIGSGEAPRYNRYMCGVLNAIAQTTEDCDRLLSFIRRVEDGTDDQVETGGNDVTLTLKRSGVQVDIEINEDWGGRPEGHFTLQEWRIVTEEWRRFLELPEPYEVVV